MQFRIGIADLAANAIIESMQCGRARELSYREIENYGCEVRRVLELRKEKVVLILSREHTERFLHDYSDFFEPVNISGSPGIALKRGKSKEDLIDQFRGYLALDLLRAFTDPAAVRTLQEAEVRQ